MMVTVDRSQFSFEISDCRHLRDFYNKLRRGNRSYAINVSERLKLDIEIDCKESEIALVVFSGAKKNSPRQTTPFFSGKGLDSFVDCTMIRISDPVFYIDNKCLLGWYGGSSDFRLQKTLPKILNEIGRRLGIKRFVFFGGSGGGFASLYYSSYFKNSLAIIFNPQTNIVRYPAGNYGVIEFYAKIAFACSRFELDKYIEVDLNKLYARGLKNRIIYMQNISDSHAMRDCKPFIEGFGVQYPVGKYSDMIVDGLYLHVSDWSEGHKPPPRGALRSILGEVLRNEFEFEREVLRGLFAQAERGIIALE